MFANIARSKTLIQMTTARSACVRPLVALLAVGVLTACGGSESDPNRVTTDKGTVVGAETSGMRQFLGIPYGAPPIGQLRWVAPQAASPWSSPRDATKFAPHCPQPATAFGKDTNTAEDCLYLNVYRPKTGDGYPVMVYVHGGANYLGEGDDYDPTQLVNKGVVVVTINYRLGALGFLSHKALSDEQGGASGNYGILDQQAALRWVQSNVANFGGDKNNVTLFGESAGGSNVHAQLASPLSKGLFHKAIVQSSYVRNNPTLAAAEITGSAFSKATDCSDQSAACLRSLSVDKILAKQGIVNGLVGALAAVDNRVLTSTTREAFKTGNFARVPVMQGSTLNEGSLITAFFFDFDPSTVVTATNYDANVAVMLNAYQVNKPASEALASYPLSAYASPVKAMDALITDSSFACYSRDVLQALSKYTPTYQYEFADASARMIYLPDTTSHTAGTWGAYHASELQYLFDIKPSYATPQDMTAPQQTLSSQMVSFWANFAKAGNPNAPGQTTWPQYSATNEVAYSLKPEASGITTDFSDRHRCNVWAGT
jgi:para-nitrobenzyl esterase